MVDYTPASIRTITSDTAFELTKFLKKVISSGIAEAVSDGVESELRKFGDGLKSAVGGHGGYRSLATANQDLAKAAQQSIVFSYDQVVTARRSAPPYRQSDPARLLTGTLRKALEAEGLVVGTYNGFAIGNIPALYAAAASYRRLNYGAESLTGAGPGRVPGREPGSFPLVLFGTTVGVLTDLSPPSPGFSMPRGKFYDTGEFFPNKRRPGEHQPIPTSGIAARRFFDAGLQRIAKEMPVRYKNLLTQWTDQAIRQSRGPVKSYYK